MYKIVMRMNGVKCETPFLTILLIYFLVSAVAHIYPNPSFQCKTIHWKSNNTREKNYVAAVVPFFCMLLRGTIMLSMCAYGWTGYKIQKKTIILYFSNEREKNKK